MATLKIYKTQIVPERNFLVQDIDDYLNSLTPTYTDTNFQFVKPYLDTSIKIETSLDTWGTEDIENTSITPMLGNYLSITETLDGSAKTFYYYIMGAAFTAEGTVSLQISLDTINTYSDYLYNTNNYTTQTNISRETRTRWKWDTNTRFKPIIDKFSENLDLSPDSYYRSTDKTISEGQANPLNVDWYVVYKARNSVIASGQNASSNVVDTYLVPSEATTLVQYSYTGDYDGIEANYDGGYEPYTADTADPAYGVQFDTVDYLHSGAPSSTTTFTVHTTYGDAELNIIGISTLANVWSEQGVPFVGVYRWTQPYITDQYSRRWELYRAYISGQSPDNAGSNSKLYITGIYYNAEVNKYIGARGTSSISSDRDAVCIYSSNANLYVNAASAMAGCDFKFGGVASTVPEYTQFDSPSQIKLNVSGGVCDWTYGNKIVVFFPKDIKSIKSYDSNTGTYSATFFDNTPTGSTVHNIYKYVEGYNTLDRTDSKLIKIIRCPYCPVNYTKETIQNGYHYSFEGFTQNATDVDSVVELKKVSNPTDYAVDLASNSSNLLYVNSLSGGSAPVDSVITTTYLYNDPKLHYGQDTLIRKYAFDNQILNVPYERYDFNLEGLPKVKDDITYMHTREIASDLLFTIKSDDINNNAESYTNYDYGNILLSSRNLEEPILNNDYLNYMRYGYNYEKTTMEQNIQAQQLSTGIGTATSILGGTVGGALAGAKFGGPAGAAAGAIIGLASSILSSTSKIITMNASIEAARNSFNQKLDTLRNQSTAVRSNNAVDLLDAYSGVKLKYFEYMPVDELKYPIAKLYHYCGYAHPVQETPKWCRYWFDFIQCSPVFKDNIFKNIYGNYQQDIVYRFENGITILHNRGTSLEPSYNWEQDKQNWETELTLTPEIKSITIGTEKYTKTGNTTTIDGVTYYLWGRREQGRYAILTLSDAPAIGDTAYIRLILSQPVRVFGNIDHVNWGV